MVRVCTDTLINEKNPNRNGFYLEDVLKDNLDILIKNIKHDWDFLIIISGGGRVRIGKSVLAMQIAYYWKDQMKKVYNIDVPFNLKDNIVFKGTELISKGNYLGKNFPYSPLMFDEAGVDLQAIKFMRRTTQDVKDFLRECGQYNLLTILVLPEFFDLPKGVALSRSDCLIDVFTIANDNGLFERGFFNFYSRPSKKMLYLKGKKELNYSAHPKDFHGRFYNNYPIDEQEYRQAKQKALVDREMDTKLDKYLQQRNVLFKFLFEKEGYTQQKISEVMRNYGINITQTAISKAIMPTRDENITNIVYNEDDGDGEEQT